MIRFTLLLSIVAAASACDPYDPDLGPTPFECGGDNDACPEGYTCNTTIDVCEKTQGAAIDAPAFSCTDDARLEPNDMPNQAYVTTIPTGGFSTGLLGISICPGSDVDHYAFGVSDEAKNLEVLVAGLADRPSLQVDLLNSNGTTILSGRAIDGTPQQVRMEMTSNRLGIGDYFVRVRSTDASQNNYNITIKTCTAPLPCP